MKTHDESTQSTHGVPRSVGVRFKESVRAWTDAYAQADVIATRPPDDIDVVRVLPFVLVHVSVIAVLWVGVSWIAALTAVVLYCVRMWGITAFYHRYFSHRAFKTSRLFQFIGAFLGAMSAQRGPLWWASHHRHHHMHADAPEDVHSPRQQGFLWSHVLWFLANKNFATRTERIRDYATYPELVFLDRFTFVAPLLLMVLLYVYGMVLSRVWPGLGTSGWQMVIWGFSISTVALYHSTFTINSLDHMWGTRRYATPDDSRNNLLFAILTLGEGWHNNHHHYPPAARNGFFAYEIDVTYYVLYLLSLTRVVWDVRGVPTAIRARGQREEA